MGSYPFDTVPQLAKYSFAINNSAPSKDRGEHLIMIAPLDKNNYFADSLGKMRSLSNKKVSANGSSEAKKKQIIFVNFTQFI